MRVLAVDPGLRSGLAVHRYKCWDTYILDPMATVDHADDELRSGLDLIVCEAYKITARTAQLSAQHWSLELIGALRWLAHSYNVPFQLQTPADAKSFVPDQRLRDLDMWVPGKEDHARDATRHLVLALAKRGELRVPPIGG